MLTHNKTRSVLIKANALTSPGLKGTVHPKINFPFLFTHLISFVPNPCYFISSAQHIKNWSFSCNSKWPQLKPTHKNSKSTIRIIHMIHALYSTSNEFPQYLLICYSHNLPLQWTVNADRITESLSWTLNHEHIVKSKRKGSMKRIGSLKNDSLLIWTQRSGYSLLEMRIVSEQ